MNINYTLTNRYNTWELEVKLEGLDDDNYSGYLNQEAELLCLACPQEQYDNITDSFTPYKYSTLNEAQQAINTIEAEKITLINNYLSRL